LRVMPWTNIRQGRKATPSNAPRFCCGAGVNVH
jgi:hypothetical protein